MSRSDRFRDVLYLFRPLMFDADDKPRQNNLYRGGAGMASSSVTA